jgi:hypothetical protein
MDDGSEDEFGPGEVSLLPPGHDAWVVGDEPVVVIDILGMANLGPGVGISSDFVGSPPG